MSDLVGCPDCWFSHVNYSCKISSMIAFDLVLELLVCAVFRRPDNGCI